MSKNGYDPAIIRGVQTFTHGEREFRVCYYGSVLDKFAWGDRVFFQNGQGKYWFGTVQRDCFCLIMEYPITLVLEGLTYLVREDEIARLHEDGWFVDKKNCRFEYYPLAPNKPTH
ncbi:hypothetical protein [Klebsiella pneumoniae]|uniref:hypothetical protein n=1 Tax=Klebsiella pneumoniae TaxID=573 RepID=UPI00300AE623